MPIRADLLAAQAHAWEGIGQPGTWWNHWIAWLQPHAGARVKARANLGSRKFQPIEPAPGRYVKARAD